MKHTERGYSANKTSPSKYTNIDRATGFIRRCKAGTIKTMCE